MLVIDLLVDGYFYASKLCRWEDVLGHEYGALKVAFMDILIVTLYLLAMNITFWFRHIDA
jgi:hypothetical protein